MPEAASPSLQASEGIGAAQAGHAILCLPSTGSLGKWDLILQICLSPGTQLTCLAAARSRAQHRGTESLEIEAGLTRFSCSCEAAHGMDAERAGDVPEL